jgi:hypothetical protein
MKSVLEAMTELVSRGYPKDTAYRIASGDLPMDRASRMESRDIVMMFFIKVCIPTIIQKSQKGI